MQPRQKPRYHAKIMEVLERSPSGLWNALGKRAGGQSPQGVESPPLRQKKPNIKSGFLFLMIVDIILKLSNVFWVAATNNFKIFINFSQTIYPHPLTFNQTSSYIIF